MCRRLNDYGERRPFQRMLGKKGSHARRFLVSSQRGRRCRHCPDRELLVMRARALGWTRTIIGGIAEIAHHCCCTAGKGRGALR